MPRIIYRKLVRDRIPDVIEASGRSCQTRTLPHEEYLAELKRKLREEVEEYEGSGALEELADILEVVRALALASGHTLDALEEARARKAEERGAFTERVFLEFVE